MFNHKPLRVEIVSSKTATDAENSDIVNLKSFDLLIYMVFEL
jgi:hypothetical protein